MVTNIDIFKVEQFISTVKNRQPFYTQLPTVTAAHHLVALLNPQKVK